MSEPSDRTDPSSRERERIEGRLAEVLPGFELVDATLITLDGDSPVPDERSGVFVSPDISSLADHYARVFPDLQEPPPRDVPWEPSANEKPLPDRDGWLCHVRRAGGEDEKSPELAIILSLTLGVIGIQTGS
ncbi:MAG: hypothetical protein ACJ789_07510 [Thermomicrobiales bacterium]